MTERRIQKRQCTMCGKEKPLKYFKRQHNKNVFTYDRCKDCRKLLRGKPKEGDVLKRCPICGGDIYVDPTAKSGKCPHCDIEFNIAKCLSENPQGRVHGIKLNPKERIKPPNYRSKMVKPLSKYPKVQKSTENPGNNPAAGK